MMLWIGLLLLLLLAISLAYIRAPLWVWTLVGAAVLVAITITGYFGGVAAITLWVVFAVPALLFNLRPLRRQLVTRHVLRVFRRVLPRMSDTEREAIDAGTVWWDAELFSGRPDWQRLLSVPAPRLSDEEQAFLDGSLPESLTIPT